MPPPQSGCLMPAVLSPQHLKLKLALAAETDAFRAVDALITMALFRGRKMKGPATEAHIHNPWRLLNQQGPVSAGVLPCGSIRWQRASVLSASICNEWSRRQDRNRRAAQGPEVSVRAAHDWLWDQPLSLNTSNYSRSNRSQEKTEAGLLLDLFTNPDKPLLHRD